MTGQRLRAGVYGRESKDKEKSIDDQIAESREAVLDNDWILVADYTDGASASRFGTKVRRGWKRLLADLEAGQLDVIVAWEPSRADRDLETWVSFVAKCRSKGVLVHVTGDGDTLDPRNPSHWRRLVEGGVDAAMESEKISKRVRRGVASAAVSGEFHGDCPFGYERVIVGERPTPHGPKPLKEQRPHPEHAPIVVEIFERLARNDSINAMILDFNARGLVAPAGGRWHRNSIRKIGLNVAYLGQRSHKGQVYQGKWPALVTEKLFLAAKKVLTDPSRKRSHPGRTKYLLSYLMTAPCGERLQYQPNGRRVASYHCHVDGCVAIGAEETEEFITQLVVERLSRGDLRTVFTSDDEAVLRARDEAAALRAKLDEARASFAKPVGGISAESLADIEQRLTPLILDADARSVSITAPLAVLELMSAAEFGVEKIRPAFDRLPILAKREMIRLLFADIAVAKPTKRLTRWATPEYRLEIAKGRISVRWRGPEEFEIATPIAVRQRKPDSAGGARAQRRAKTTIDIPAQRQSADQPEQARPRGWSASRRAAKLSP